MASRLRVQLASARSDRPHWLGVAAVAIGGLAGGVVLASALGRSLANEEEPAAEFAARPEARPSAPRGTEPEPDQHAITASEPEYAAVDAGTLHAASVANAGVATAPDAALPDVAAAAAPAVVAPTPVEAVATSSTHELIRGQIAYLRCEGVPLEPGPFPCPRDRRFEKQVWTALEALQQCALPADSGGDVELRVEFRTRGRRTFEVRPAVESPALAEAASKCLAAGMEPVRTQLHPILMTVAFRFELR